MALFLTESVQAPVSQITLEEAHMGLLECVTHLAELTEATLQADFIIHEKTRGLSESVILEKEEGFFTKVAKHVVTAIEKVKAHVVAFFQKVGQHLKAAWAKLAKRGTISIPKGAAKAINEAVAKLKALDAAVRSNEKDATKYSDAVVKAKKEAEETTTSILKAIGEAREAKAFETVKVSALNNVQAAANQIAGYAGTASTDLAAAIKAAEKAEAEAKGKETELKAAQADLARAKAAATAYTALAATAGRVSTVIGRAVFAGATAPKE